MKSIAKLTNWLDQHILQVFAGFLLVFLPLYPKWPIADILPGYNVRLRLEDFVVLAVFIIFLIQVKRGKASLRKNPLFIPIIIYLVIGLLSSLSAIFITKTVLPEALHMGKLFLHWARRVEYMSLALIFFSAVPNRRTIKRYMSLVVITTVLISLYGLGQKYLQWPVYSTMNREFSKGWRLVLTDNARVSSTFAGHYDLAAYAVALLPLIATLMIVFKPKNRIWLSISFFLLFTSLLLTVSRTSFIAYGASFIVLAFLVWRKHGWKPTLANGSILLSLTLISMLFFGRPLYQRYAHLLMLDRFDGFIEKNISSKFSSTTKNAQNSINLPNDMRLVYTPTDTPPTPVNPIPTQKPRTSGSTDLPPDVYEAIPENFPEASLSAIPATSGTGSEGKPRKYSDSAFTFGLSSAIRFDALWPRAFEGFRRNPLLGSGYSTLLKVENTDFTEAESTDNDYLRALGETGLLGFISFFGIFVYALYKSIRLLPKLKDPWETAFILAFISGLVALMINALYIDVFVASKIAYTVWAFMGLTFGLIYHIESDKTPTKKPSSNKKTS